MPTPIKLNGLVIDGFAIISNPVSQCSHMKCRRKSKVHMFWSTENGPQGASQQRESVCFQHAIDFANDVIMKRKFGRDRA